jgi:hypothetical protein
MTHRLLHYRRGVEGFVMTVSISEIYRSSNGDRWQLIRTADPERTLVRHIPNPLSGGRTTDTAVGDFLSIDGPGPEYTALQRLLGSTADGPPNR